MNLNISNQFYKSNIMNSSLIITGFRIIPSVNRLINASQTLKFGEASIDVILRELNKTKIIKDKLSHIYSLNKDNNVDINDKTQIVIKSLFHYTRVIEICQLIRRKIHEIFNLNSINDFWVYLLFHECFYYF